jgi:hypothetical protein
MATVTSITVARAEEIENNSVVGGHISGNDLVLETAGGTSINVGRVIQPAATNWPIGSIFMHTSNENPNILLGGGTWVRWGRGRMSVGVDEADTAFDSVEKTGGEKDHILTTPEMPSHAHTGGTTADSPDHAHTGGTAGMSANHHHGATDAQGNHAHDIYAGGGNRTGGGSANTMVPGAGPTGTGAAGTHAHNTGWANADHSHAFTTAGATARHAHGIYAEGGGGAHNNLPPYITVYMWKRTA